MTSRAHQIGDEGLKGAAPANPHLQRRLIKLLALALTLLVLGLLCYQRELAYHDYPPGHDQDGYLAGGQEFAEHFIFEWRAPLYSAWMALFYVISGRDLQTCYYLEKVCSLLLLSLLLGLLGRKLFNTPTGILLGLWVLSCKYLMLEINGTHSLAASLFTLSMLCLWLSKAALRLPLALLLMFFATQMRQDMWLPFLAVTGCVLLYALKVWLRGQDSAMIPSLRRPADLRYWAVAAAIGLAVGSLIYLRLGPPVQHRVELAFAQTFAINYVERHGVPNEAADTWDGAYQITERALPDFGKGPLATWREYPAEMRSHLLYNLKVGARAMVSMVLSFNPVYLMPLLLLLYLSLYFIRGQEAVRKDNWRRLPAEMRPWQVVWMASVLLIVPLTILLRASARYYIPLIPSEIIFLTFILRSVMKRIAPGRQVRAEP